MPETALPTARNHHPPLVNTHAEATRATHHTDRQQTSTRRIRAHLRVHSQRVHRARTIRHAIKRARPASSAGGGDLLLSILTSRTDPRGCPAGATRPPTHARNLLSDLANGKCFRSGFRDDVRSIVAQRPATESPLWHPPKGAPREPSTSCQSRRAAAMARASRPQRLRRRHLVPRRRPDATSSLLRQDRTNLHPLLAILANLRGWLGRRGRSGFFRQLCRFSLRG